MTAFPRAAFLAAAGDPSQFPPEGPPEVAFLGRSNVGKSSAINALAGRRRLAFASKTPGRTQTANFYDLEGRGRLVDLPGYGYAQAPQAERARWERLVGAYLFGRRTLAALVLLMDARRPLLPSDLELLRWLAPLGVPRLALLTKADKLTRAERASALAQARAQIPDAVLFSSLRRDGVDEARERLAQWLRDASAAAGNKRPPAKGKTTGGETP